MTALVPSILVFWATLAAGQSPEPRDHTDQNQRPTDADLAAFLREAEADRAADVRHDAQGQIASLTLYGPSASDRGLILASRLTSLRSLTVQGHGTGYTQQAASSLHLLTNLVTLKIICPGSLEPGFLREVCRHPGLRELQLTAAMPPPAEYQAIASLRALQRLGIANCTNFGDTELRVVTNLQNLEQLELINNRITRSGTNVLRYNRTLTNLLFMK